ncbi:MAG: enoyl-CoA hydratase [Sneathiella sp.]|jgi:enoyl-CoA hydratase|uniref:crotonase/enoyl-CoA hydratase family protein n=1 Tax=Sneathiella sp. TaxID=1964365 RepID=UPI000C543497|nr:crotonase/enoyl-CoA hydratase family protein [Sneathiella sp.]MAL80072.1 enoyl-CoA hydratase [Sneathiella sp.]
MKSYADGKIKVENRGAVTIVTIDRPAQRNACTVEMVKALHDAFLAFEQDATSRVAILTGAGGYFSAGADLEEISSGSAIGYSWAGKDKGATRRRLSKPVIAAVEGHAVAAGLALAVWCDMRVASKSAVFGVFCRRFGGPMPNGATVRLPRIIGESRALDMLMTGRPVKAEEAYHIGLADRLAETGEALAAALTLAEQLAAFPQSALLCDRKSAIEQWDYPEEEAIDREIEGAKFAFRDAFQSGAGTFVKGIGRHGEFS